MVYVSKCEVLICKKPENEWVLGPITPIHYIDLGVSWSHHNSHEQQSVGYKFGSRVSLSYKSIGGLIKNSSCKHKGKFNSNSFEWWPLWPPLDFLRAFYDKKVFQIKGMNIEQQNLLKKTNLPREFTKYSFQIRILPVCNVRCVRWRTISLVIVVGWIPQHQQQCNFWIEKRSSWVLWVICIIIPQEATYSTT